MVETSASVGAALEAPRLVVDKAPQAAANRTASGKLWPSAKA